MDTGTGSARERRIDATHAAQMGRGCAALWRDGGARPTTQRWMSARPPPTNERDMPPHKAQARTQGMCDGAASDSKMDAGRQQQHKRERKDEVASAECHSTAPGHSNTTPRTEAGCLTATQRWMRVGPGPVKPSLVSFSFFSAASKQAAEATRKWATTLKHKRERKTRATAQPTTQRWTSAATTPHKPQAGEPARSEESSDSGRPGCLLDDR